MTVLILTYHHIVKDEEMACNSWFTGAITLSRFKLHVKWLSYFFKIINPDQLRDFKKISHTFRPLLVLSFDDGTCGHLLAQDYLKSIRKSGVYFILSNEIKNQGVMWSDKLNWIFHNLSLEKYVTYFNKLDGRTPIKCDGEKRVILAQSKSFLKTFRKSEIDIIVNDLFKTIDSKVTFTPPFSLQFLDKDGINNLQSLGGVIGSHGHSHQLFTKMNSEQEAESELSVPKNILESITGKKCTHFCFPNGSYYPAQVVLANKYYEHVYTVDTGINRRFPAKIYKRINVPGNCSIIKLFALIIRAFVKRL